MTISSMNFSSGYSFQGLVAPFALRERVAIVTGAAGLLGRQHCIALAQAGAYIVATDLDGQTCAGVTSEINEMCGPVETLAASADITRPQEVLELRKRVLERFGRVDVLVNNAAINDKVEGRESNGPIPFEDFPLQQWQAAIDANLTGTFLCCQIIGAEMAKRRCGSIINVASTYGMVGPDQRIYRDSSGRQLLYKSPAYSATKAAIIGLTKYLAAYWGPAHVRVNALSPGGVKTTQDSQFVTNYSERTPLGRMANPEDYRGAITYLASDASSYVTGSNLVVDGGWTAW
jgi:NAD(P)-dependent dehydrogenase (short-subunit alcohol dehydrogenase family)